MCLVHLGAGSHPIEVVSDCQAIVQGFNATLEWQHDPRNRFAHFWSQVATSVKTIHKVKAHCTPQQAAALGQMQWFTGNATADELANKALPYYEPSEVEGFLRDQTAIHMHVKSACRVLANYEALCPMGRQLRAAPRTKRPKARKSRRAHKWTWLPRAGCFVCQTCAATCRKQKRKVSAAHARGHAAFCTTSISPTKPPSRPGSMHPNSPWFFVVGVEDTPSRKSVSSPSRASHRGQGGLLRSSRGCGRAGTPLIVPL